MFASPPPTMPQGQAYLNPVFLDEAKNQSITGSGVAVDLSLDIGSASNHRHLLFLVSHSIEERDQDQGSAGLDGTFKINGELQTPLFGWHTSDDYLPASVSSVFDVYHAVVPSGSQCTGTITPTGYDLNEVKHIAVYQIERPPLLIAEVKQQYAADDGTKTLSPTYETGCSMFVFASGVLNNGLFNSERFQSSIGHTQPATQQECAARIPNASNTSGAFKVYNYDGSASIEVSHAEYYRNTNYPTARYGYAVTLR